MDKKEKCAQRAPIRKMAPRVAKEKIHQKQSISPSVPARKSYARAATVNRSLMASQKLEELQERNRQRIKKREVKVQSTDKCSPPYTSPLPDVSSGEEDGDLSLDLPNPKESAILKQELKHKNRSKGQRMTNRSYKVGLRRKVRKGSVGIEQDFEECKTRTLLEEISESTLDHEMLRFEPAANICGCGKMFSNFTMLVIHKLSCGREVNNQQHELELMADPDYIPGLDE